ncbi:MAG: D-alanyl-D-alanine carboxypeptidase/D-alanyl-D-alanine-endopeptidase [Solirubrobacteraceae bacterium]
MRRRLALSAAVLTLIAASVSAAAAVPASAAQPHAPAARGLTNTLSTTMRAAGRASGAVVLDLNTGQTLFSDNPRVGRLPASVQKLYTTSAALLKFGPRGTLSTSVLGVGSMRGATFVGTLYLRGGGDPTFGSAGFDHANYGTGANVQRLAGQLRAATGLGALQGAIVADESMLDSRRGTPATGYAPSGYVEGELSALSFNRGWADAYGSTYVPHPAIESGQQLGAALRAAGVKVPAATRIRAGTTPAGAQPLTALASPPMATLLALTNTPSDNFFAETLLKDLGARFGAGGSTTAGVGVVAATIAATFGLHPRFDDGSGLSGYDRTTPSDVVSLLRQQAADRPFISSLAVAGETGTLAHEMRGTYAQGRCRGKTGTLTNASNVVGYCHARDGHTLAYALLMNSIDPNYAHPLQNRIQIALARYNG